MPPLIFTPQVTPCREHTAKRVYSVHIPSVKWWSRWESNPRPTRLTLNLYTGFDGCAVSVLLDDRGDGSPSTSSMNDVDTGLSSISPTTDDGC